MTPAKIAGVGSHTREKSGGKPDWYQSGSPAKKSGLRWHPWKKVRARSDRYRPIGRFCPPYISRGANFASLNVWPLSLHPPRYISDLLRQFSMPSWKAQNYSLSLMSDTEFCGKIPCTPRGTRISKNCMRILCPSWGIQEFCIIIYFSYL